MPCHGKAVEVLRGVNSMSVEDQEGLQEETWWWARPGSRRDHVKLEETVTLDKHRAVARFPLWKFSAP